MKKKAEAPSTEKVSPGLPSEHLGRQLLGRQCELRAAEYCEELGYQILGKNLRFKIGEVDLLVKDNLKRRLILVEVRGRRTKEHFPSQMISRAKVRRLKLLQKCLQKQYTLPVHIELFEVRIAEKTELKTYRID